MLPSLLGIGIFRTPNQDGCGAEAHDELLEAASSSSAASPPRDPYPYETPDPSGKNWLYELPEEVMRDILLRLDLQDLTRCFRLSKYFNEFGSQSAALNLRHALLANSLHLNPHAIVANPDVPHQMPLSSAKILAHLRETLTRFRNVTPKSESRVKFREPSGSLYEYLEGVLLRTSRPPGGSILGRSRTLHVYDLRRVDEWEDADDVMQEDDNVFETSSDSPMEGDYKSEHTFDFDIMEVATDPTQDLLVIVSLTMDEPGQTTQRYKMELHLFTLSTFEPHPKAKNPVLEFPQALYKPKVQLGFQICDDGLYVLSQRMSITGNNRHVQIPDHLTGWQWTTGRRHVDLDAPNTVTFESFVLLTPWSFIVPVSIARLHSSDIVEEIEDIRDLYWTNHLWLYAFPPFGAGADDDERFGATHVATLDVPPMENNIAMGVPPMYVSIRTDPPPRHTASPYPLHAPPAYLPDPESGVAIIDFGFNQRILQMHPELNDRMRFTLVLQKPVLIKHLPDPMSPMLRRVPPSRAVPVVPWEKLAPDARFFGPDRLPTNWVCFVYQNRYVSPYARVVGRLERDSDDENEDDDDDEPPEVVEIKLQVFDFDPRRTRKEKLERARRLPAGVEPKDEALEGDVDGIELVLSETVVSEIPHILKEPVRTGQNFPYIVVEKDTDSLNPLIDGQRVLQLIHKRRPFTFDDDSDEDSDDEDEVQIMEF